MALEQMQAARQDLNPVKKLQLRKETVKDLTLGQRAAAWPCGETDEDGSEQCDSEECETTQQEV